MRLLLRASGEGPGFDGEQFAFVDLTPDYVRHLLRWHEQLLEVRAKNPTVTALRFPGDLVRFHRRFVLHDASFDPEAARIDGGPDEYVVLAHDTSLFEGISTVDRACYVGPGHLWWSGVRSDGNVTMETVALPWTFLHLPEAVAERTAKP